MFSALNRDSSLHTAACLWPWSTIPVKSSSSCLNFIFRYLCVSKVKVKKKHLFVEHTADVPPTKKMKYCSASCFHRGCRSSHRFLFLSLETVLLFHHLSFPLAFCFIILQWDEPSTNQLCSPLLLVFSSDHSDCIKSYSRQWCHINALEGVVMQACPNTAFVQ